MRQIEVRQTTQDKDIAYVRCTGFTPAGWREAQELVPAPFQESKGAMLLRRGSGGARRVAMSA